MKKSLTVGLVVAALAATLTFVAASSIKREAVIEADALSAYEILTTLREMGLNSINEPVRRGPYYVLHAYDPRGVEVRVVADAQFGDILSVAPAKALNAAYAPRYDRSPRIIHVPQPGGRDDRTSINQRGGPALSNEDDDEEIASPPRRRVPPKPQQRSDEPRRKPVSASPSPQRRSDAPPPPGPRRAVLSAPPPPAESLTPVRPTPRFNSKSDPTEKFGARDPALTSSTPPVGYTPPSGLPRND